MKFEKAVKTISLIGATSLTLFAGASQADWGYNPNNNPWLSGPGYQQAHYQAAFKQQVAEFDQRLDNQLQRILNGMENGKLSMREAVGLIREHVSINRMERQYLADGRLGPNELRDLDRRLGEAGKHIFQEKHEGERLGFQEHRPAEGRRYR